MNRILIIGPLPHKNNFQTFGGATISMQNLIDHCNRNHFQYGFIQTSRYRYGKNRFLVVNLFYTLYRLVININKYDVIMLNVSSRGALYSGPLIYFICKLYRKKTVFRKFGGGLDYLLEDKKNVAKKLAIKYLLKSNLILTETKYMVKYLYDIGIKNALWFPNVRKAPDKQPILRNGFNKRFVFISHVTENKGIFEIINAADLLSSDYSIDIYGPIKDNNISIDIFLNSKAIYKGILMPDEVTSTLREYDVLVLPTYYKGEGYPGIIIEALSMGIPVISTRFRSIPEIIDEKNGILVEPKNHVDLYNAIISFNEENITSYRRAALQSFSSYNEETVYNSALNVMYNL